MSQTDVQSTITKSSTAPELKSGSATDDTGRVKLGGNSIRFGGKAIKDTGRVKLGGSCIRFGGKALI